MKAPLPKKCVTNGLLKEGRPHHWMRHERTDYPLTCPLFFCWGVTLHTLALDILHTVDLGVCGHAVANLLWEIVF